MTIKLYYFPFPGRGEVSRLILTAGDVQFEDVRVPRTDWMAFKPKTPFGQMPVLEVDGTMIAQSKAIEAYCAKIAGFYPEDPLEAAKADMVVHHLEDINQLFSATFNIVDLEEKIKKRQELLAGPAKDKLVALDNLLEGKDYVAGSKLSHGDIVLFVSASFMRSGMLDGVPTNILDYYPNIRRLRNRIAEIDFIKATYANETEAPRAAFKPEV